MARPLHHVAPDIFVRNMKRTTPYVIGKDRYIGRDNGVGWQPSFPWGKWNHFCSCQERRGPMLIIHCVAASQASPRFRGPSRLVRKWLGRLPREREPIQVCVGVDGNMQKGSEDASSLMFFNIDTKLLGEILIR